MNKHCFTRSLFRSACFMLHLFEKVFIGLLLCLMNRQLIIPLYYVVIYYNYDKPGYNGELVLKYQKTI